MNRSFVIILLCCSLPISMQATSWQTKAKITGASLLVTSATYLLSRGYAHALVSAAQARFATERALLNHYAYYAHYWNAETAEQLKTYLKTEIVRLHNINRDKWSVTILYERYHGQPSYFIDKQYAHFPLLQHKYDLDWYIRRLKVIRFFRLYPRDQEFNLLIDQLIYMRNMLITDLDYNKEEQQYTLIRKAGDLLNCF